MPDDGGGHWCHDTVAPVGRDGRCGACLCTVRSCMLPSYTDPTDPAESMDDQSTDRFVGPLRQLGLKLLLHLFKLDGVLVVAHEDIEMFLKNGRGLGAVPLPTTTTTGPTTRPSGTRHPGLLGHTDWNSGILLFGEGSLQFSGL